MRIAVIDIGSNTVKFDLYETGEKTALLLRRAETVGLARYCAEGILTAEGTAALCGVLRDFCGGLRLMQCERIVAVATAALRGIRNAEEVLAAVKAQTGLSVRILSGKDEARLSYESVRASLVPFPSRGISADMGGGSTDVIVFAGDAFIAHSFPFGALRLRERFVSDVRPTREEMKQIRSFVRAEWKMAEIDTLDAQTLFLIGGTAKAIGKILCEREGIPFTNGTAFPAKRLEALEAAYRAPGKKAIDALIRFAPERLHTLIPGLSAYTALCRAAVCETVVFTSAGLRDGIIRRIEKGEWDE